MPTYHPNKTPASNALTDLIRAVLRMSANADKIGTRLIKGLGLTSARWQTLGELYMAEERFTVSQLARRMGLSRQAVQRLIDEMAADGFVALLPNPADQRAMQVQLTEAGRTVYQNSLEQEWVWANLIADGFEPAELQDAVRLIEAVTEKMRASH